MRLNPNLPWLSNSSSILTPKLNKSLYERVIIFVIKGYPHIMERKGTKLNLFYLFAYAAYYDGEWKNGLPHGSGRLIYDDGSIYEGCFKEGSA